MTLTSKLAGLACLVTGAAGIYANAKGYDLGAIDQAAWYVGETINQLFQGYVIPSPGWIEVPVSAGLAVGGIASLLGEVKESGKEE